MSPFIFPILASIIRKEKIQKWDYLGIAVGFVGALLIIKPFRAFDINDDETILKDLIGCAFALVAAFFGGLVSVYVKQLTTSGLHYSIVPVYYSLGNIILSPIFSFLNPPLQHDL